MSNIHTIFDNNKSVKRPRISKPNNPNPRPNLNKCSAPRCNKTPYYNLISLKPRYCRNHARIGMKFNPRKKCTTDNCDGFASHAEISHRKSEGAYCEDCAVNKPNHGPVKLAMCSSCNELMPALKIDECGKCKKPKH